MDKKNARQLYLMKLFLKETDEDHRLTMEEILSRLAAMDIDVKRRAIYDDIEALDEFGIVIQKEKNGRNTYYFTEDRTFEIPELKLLVDSVQASRFITERKSRDLIKKLGTLASNPQARELDRQVVISGRVKSMNESIYYNVDAINRAINTDSQITFDYRQWDLNKNLVPKHEGKKYVVSPWGLVINEENYYLVGYEVDRIKHYRVDKMLGIRANGRPRQGKEFYHADEYKKKSLFGMYGGQVEPVTFRAKNWIAGILFDRFGTDITISRIDDAHFETKVDIAISPQFFGWLFALGPDIQIIGPEDVVKRFTDYGNGIMGRYN